MRRAALLIGVLAGLVLAFVLCGGASMVGSVTAALQNPPAPVSVDSLR